MTPRAVAGALLGHAVAAVASVPRAAVAVAFLALFALASAVPASAAHVVVAPEGRPGFAEAVRGAKDGDVIDVLPGEYRGQVAVIEQERLTIRGIGKRPVLLADRKNAEGKAILVVRDGNVTIENVEFRGARVGDADGAAIRFEKGRLRVVRCAFFDNENGILTANFGTPSSRSTRASSGRRRGWASSSTTCCTSAGSRRSR